MATMMVIRNGSSSRSICRLCFMEREQSQPIFGDNSPSLNEWICSLTSLKIIDAPNAPASLCLECKTTLEDFESFIEMCRTNDCVFNEMFLRANQEHVPTEQNDFSSTLPVDSGTAIEYQQVKEEIIEETGSDTNDTIPPEQKYTNDNGTSGKKTKSGRCEICKRGFNDIDEHLLIHNTTYQCKLCPKAFAKLSLFRSHMYRHRLKRKFICKECNKGFKYLIDLTNHLRIHSKEKPFKCKYCGNAYRAQTNLTRHQKIHKKVEHQCEHCESRFTSMEGFERHKRLVVRDKYWCKVCNEKFPTCDHLIYHRKTTSH